jgi:hypothetical protein
MQKRAYVFRKDKALFGEEFEICRSVLGENRVFWLDDHLPRFAQGTLIIPRYCAHPFYAEFHALITRGMGCRLLTDVAQFNHIAGFRYVRDIENLTPKTYFNPSDVKPHEHGWIVRGAYRSLKWKWNTHMRVKEAKDLMRVSHHVMDTLETDEIIIREYQPLRTFEIGINGLPFTNEYRVIFLNGKVVDSGYYWSIAERLPEGKTPEAALNKAQEAAERLTDHIWLCVDVAQTEAGDWIVIECNTGEQSGLTCMDPESFYRAFDTQLSFMSHAEI